MDEVIELLKKCQGQMSQIEFGDLLRVDQSTISKYLAGKRTPHRDVWAALLREFPSYRDEIMSVFLRLDYGLQHISMADGIASAAQEATL